ncbi:MAG: hypothetical protein II937_14280 [Bacteroidales bacterium]|nr:hypothetical protein [Bacteroidales bacterium]
MRKTFLFIAFLAVCFSAGAQTIHWITFFDTRDDSIGPGLTSMRNIFYSRFVNEVNAALKPKGYTADVHDYYDFATNPENCKRAVENLNIKLNPHYEDDIIVFYYDGHGGRPENSKQNPNEHPFPQMCLGQSRDDKFIPLEWVHKKMKEKGARLVITIGSCCNTSHPNISVKNEPLFAANYKSASMAANQVEAIQKMFLEYSGDIIATAATPGESGWVGGFFNMFGSVYGGGMVTTFESYTNAHKSDLKEYFEINTTNVTNEAAYHRLSVHPVVWINIRNISQPVERDRDTPDDISVNNNYANNGRTDAKNNELSQYLDYMSDSRITLGRRLGIADNLKNVCTGSTRVKILAQDVDDVVDIESLEDFCDRISTSRLLLKVVPVDVTISQNQITEIRVREYYKR